MMLVMLVMLVVLSLFAFCWTGQDLLQRVRAFACSRIRATGSIALEDAQVAHAHAGGPHPPNLAELVLNAESGE